MSSKFEKKNEEYEEEEEEEGEEEEVEEEEEEYDEEDEEYEEEEEDSVDDYEIHIYEGDEELTLQEDTDEEDLVAEVTQEEEVKPIIAEAKSNAWKWLRKDWIAEHGGIEQVIKNGDYVVKESEIRAVDGLYILSSSPIAGTNIVSNHNGRQIFIFGHSEYEANTLAEEYFRDLGKLDNVELPYHYFPDDDPTQKPIRTWRSHAYLFYSNWLNYYVYQSTPYDLCSMRLDPK